MRLLLNVKYSDRRGELVYCVLRQIGTLRARWLLHRLADGLPDDAEHRYRKRMAAKAAATLSTSAVSRSRTGDAARGEQAQRARPRPPQPRDPELKKKAPDP